jgi:phosphomannomutase
VSRSGRPLADLVADRIAAFPSSGEINFRHADPAGAMAAVDAALGPEAVARDGTDGLSLAFADWRLNLRRSNTEPLLRLNVEARGHRSLVAAGVARVRGLIGA